MLLETDRSKESIRRNWVKVIVALLHDLIRLDNDFH